MCKQQRASHLLSSPLLPQLCSTKTRPHPKIPRAKPHPKDLSPEFARLEVLQLLGFRINSRWSRSTTWMRVARLLLLLLLLLHTASRSRLLPGNGGSHGRKLGRRGEIADWLTVDGDTFPDLEMMLLTMWKSYKILDMNVLYCCQ